MFFNTEAYAKLFPEEKTKKVKTKPDKTCEDFEEETDVEETVEEEEEAGDPEEDPEDPGDGSDEGSGEEV